MIGKRVDDNQKVIAAALRRAGACCIPTTGDPSIGFDLLIAYRSKLYVAEIKDGDKPLSARRLTEREEARKVELTMKGVTYNVIESVDDALRLIGVMK